MELRDLIVTPIVVLLVLAAAYYIRPRVTDENTRRYFFPALLVKIFGAIALGFLYQYYYQGGDTYNYHTYGSRVIWEAFIESPGIGWKLITSNGEYFTGSFEYASKIRFYRDPSSFFVVGVSALADLFTFSSYSATAVIFSVISFCGAWAMFIAFYQFRPGLHRWLAIATLFIPSVVFWGSGLLKDTLTLAALGILTFAINQLFIRGKFSWTGIIFLMGSIWILYSVKKYILLCFVPASFFLIYANSIAKFRSIIPKLLLFPFMIGLFALTGYYSVQIIGEDDSRYSLDKIAGTARITAYDIGFYTGRNAGSGYSLGELDGTFNNMISKFPQAVNVSLFRPYLWEVKNPLMLFSALESMVLVLFTLYVLVRVRHRLILALIDPQILFCLVFSVTFAFAVGVSTFNFGTLARYKIPLLPFYTVALIFMIDYLNKSRNLSEFDLTE
ncbi:MAG: hypothetical protein JNJ65_10450 [Cyclobacteriaceae bacterium]|nr:hypothetical protein [Cyclobacteriaceae bacterium]